MEEKIINTTVCIIGAGPSGAATSIFLQREGVQHIIIDAANFPRDKVCGDGLDMKAITMLNHVNPEIIKRELGENGNITPCWGFRLITPKGKQTNFVYSPVAGKENEPPYGVSKRMNIDAILVNEMKPENFYPSTKAKEIIKTEEGWIITASQKDCTLKIYCKLLIGADGDHSVVLKTVGERKINRNHYAGGVRQYWKNIAGIHEKNLMELYFPKSVPMSYFWIFPQNNGEANVGFGILSAVAAQKNYNIREIFTKLIAEDDVLKSRFKDATALNEVSGWGLPLASLKRKCFGEGWLLVGDAASMISPTTGEGIGTGMQTGFIASKFIKKAVIENNFSETTFKNYDREIYRRMNDDINLFNWSMKISPNVYGWVMNNIIHFKFFERLFQRKVSQWIQTAYSKTLIVTVD